MCNLLHLLPAKARSGSKPRCHSLTHGSRDEVAGRLTDLIKPFGTVQAHNSWMPRGFENNDEAQLHRASTLVKSEERRKSLKSWWLAVSRGDHTTTPNWDIASTCTINIEGRPAEDGLLLIEAKAHHDELRGEEKGKLLKAPAKTPTLRNHARIGWCMEDANLVLNDQTSLNWNLSRDSRYQMSNRFAWAWKLAELGTPVILVYLGFLNASEMVAGGRISTEKDWEKMVRDHADRHVPDEVWGKPWVLHGLPFVPLIRTMEQSLCCYAEAP